MIRRRIALRESLTADAVLAGRDPSETFAKMLADRSGVVNAELTVLLTVAEAVAMLHRTNHWTASSQSYYSDHKLFETLYDGLNEDIDTLAEKIVGLGSDAGVDVHDRINGMAQILSEMYAPHTVGSVSVLAERSLAAEFFLLRIAALAIRSMKELGSATPGVENMLQQFCDSREEAIFHLRRRTTS